MTDAIRKAAWLSLITNVVVFALLFLGAAQYGILKQLLRMATTPGWLLTSMTPDALPSAGIMLVANWVVWIALWWLAISAVREVRGAPAW